MQGINSLTSVIVDDEPVLRYHLDKMLADLWPELDVVAKVGDGQEALHAVMDLHPQILWLDIRMPTMNGMEVLRKLQSLPEPPLVVLVTAYDDYALQAFEDNAVDYLLKPVSSSRLLKCKAKLQARLVGSTEQEKNLDIAHLNQLVTELVNAKPPSASHYLQWIKATLGEDIFLIAVDDVLYFKAEDKYVLVYAQQGTEYKQYIIRMTLKALLNELNPQFFWQIHRSVVVNAAKIEKISKTLSQQMFVQIAGQRLPVSRASQHLFKGM